MSEKHLSTGSVEPPRVDGLLRVYSHKLCPFAKRARIVLKAKNLPHDIVNINLTNKPEWYFKIHPKGQVPALFDNGKIVIESLDIADYLEEKYNTQTPLYPKDPAAKKRDQEVIRNLLPGPTGLLSKVQYSSETYSAAAALDLLLPAAQPLEDELAKRETRFFGGEKPGMIDYMLWPWAEGVSALPGLLGVKSLNLKDDQIPKLRKWAKTMSEVPLVKELLVPIPKIVQAIADRKTNTFDYDTFFDY
uniref:Glutathione S-transeferase n=1 Tax=Dendroctonus armandi TaxID=77159 RepID=A0A0C4X9Q2_9CUCU|nr:glutathione S-transeferase [Dendroctonus armandi]